MIKTNKKGSKNSFILFLLLSSLGFLTLNGCIHISAAPTTANATFKIQAPDKFDCYQDKAHTSKITLSINLRTFWYDGSKRNILDEKNLVVDPNTTSFPVDMNVLLPNDGKVAYCEVNISGQNCTECGNLYSDPRETPYGSCPSGPVDINNPNGPVIGAKPRWTAGFYIPHYNCVKFSNFSKAKHFI